MRAGSLELRLTWRVLAAAAAIGLFSGVVVAESARSLFEKVVVIGASVSNDAYAPSPGKVVATQAGAQTRVTKRAKDGAKSSEHLNWIKNQLPGLNPSITFGLDLFFHDVKNKFQLDSATKNRVTEIVTRLCAENDQVYIGNTMAVGFYFAPTQLNSHLNDLARRHDNLHVVDIASVYTALHGSGYRYNINGVNKTFKKKELLKDQLHPNSKGSKVFGNLLIQEIRRLNPEISAEELPYVEIR